MNADFCEELRALAKEFCSSIDQQITILNQEYNTFSGYLENETESLQLVKSLNRRMDLFIANSLQLTVSETEDVKAKIEAATNEKRDELDSLRQVYDGNTAVKNEKKAKLTDLKSYVDGLKSKRAQLRSESANEALFGERFLMRYLDINFKMSKDDTIVAVIYKNSANNQKIVEKLISVDKGYRDENDTKHDFWRSISKTVEKNVPTKKLQVITVAGTHDVIQCTN